MIPMTCEIKSFHCISSRYKAHVLANPESGEAYAGLTLAIFLSACHQHHSRDDRVNGSAPYDTSPWNSVIQIAGLPPDSFPKTRCVTQRQYLPKDIIWIFPSVLSFPLGHWSDCKHFGVLNATLSLHPADLCQAAKLSRHSDMESEVQWHIFSRIVLAQSEVITVCQRAPKNEQL